MVTELIKPGYRKTDIGVIPDDWDVTTLDDKGIFKKGKGVKKDEVTNEGLPCIRYGEIYTRYDYYVNRFFSFIPSEVAKKSQKIQKDDLLFAGSGETAEEIGKCIAYLGDEDVYAGGDIIIFSPNEGYSLFLGYLMNYEFITKQKSKFAQGHAVVHIYAANLKKIILPFPKPQEQSAIAQALSDTDNVIDSLNKLINKKKNLKKGAMQQLLTGKERLPGFSGEWEERTLGDINSKKMVTINPRHFLEETFEYYSIPSYQDGKQPILEQGRNIFSSKILLENKVVLFGKLNPRIEKVWLIESNSKERKIGSGEWITIIPDNINVVSEYIYYLVWSESVMLIAKELVAGSTPSRQRVIPSGFYNIRVSIPRDPKEQKAIAQLLSDMDVNIENLEQQRDKYEMIKEGMMRQLLTGKIRLR